MIPGIAQEEAQHCLPLWSNPKSAFPQQAFRCFQLGHRARILSFILFPPPVYEMNAAHSCRGMPERSQLLAHNPASRRETGEAAAAECHEAPGVVRIGACQLLRAYGIGILDLLQTLAVPLHPKPITVTVYQADRMAAVAAHRAIAIRNAAVRQQDGHRAAIQRRATNNPIASSATEDGCLDSASG